MLEQANLKKRISKEEYAQRKKELTNRLISLQQECIREKLPVVICVDGWSASGKGTSISQIVKDLDPRAFRVHSMNSPSDDERRFPFMKRYWEAVGQYGTITIFDKSWYSEAARILSGMIDSSKRMTLPHPILRDSVDYIVKSGNGEAGLFAESAAMFERQLIDDGYLIIKCFFHLGKKEQKRRISALQEDKSTSWRVNKNDIVQNGGYEKWASMFDSLLELTNTAEAPWHIIAAENRRVRRIEFLEALAEEITDGLDRHRKGAEHPIVIPDNFPLPRSRYTLVPVQKVENIAHNLSISEEKYRKELREEQEKLGELQSELYRKGIPMMLVYEGWDAAGKGGNIKRVSAALDARDYRVVPSAAPTPLEKEHPFLWRYWISLPKSGHAAIYDRSWYGRVMVERVEGFCAAPDWRRAFEEINDFEWEMYRTGIIFLKFWINVSPDEQLARFEARKNDPDRAWKLTDEDWRNREKYPQYCEAVNDMFRLTSTDFAPWLIVESDDKKYARIKTLKAINKAIEKRLKAE